MRAVYCDGPFPDQDSSGDEVPVWNVMIGDENGDPIGDEFTCWDYDGAIATARKLATKHKLELVNEAMRD